MREGDVPRLHRGHGGQEAPVTVLALLCAVVFVTAFAYDWVYVRFLLAVDGRDPRRASFWSSVLSLIGLVGVAGILKYSYWLIIPDILGIATGAYFGVKTAASQPVRKIVVVIPGTDASAESRTPAPLN
jgi:hypothetical protein